jgi:hypothetical protein
MNDKVPPAARRAGFACQLGLDRNPLRRGTDWLETCIMAGLLAVFLAGAPLAAIGAASWVHAAGVREQRAQRSWRQVSVVLLQAAPRQAAFRRWSPPARVRARWAPPGEPVRAAEVWAPPGSRAGSTEQVWAGRSGPVAGVPLTGDVIAARAIAAGILAPVCLAVAVLALAHAARWQLNRRRLAAWETAWKSVGPFWTGRP